MGAGDVSNLPVSFKTQMSENILACFFSHLVYLYMFTIPDIDLWCFFYILHLVYIIFTRLIGGKSFENVVQQKVF